MEQGENTKIESAKSFGVSTKDTIDAWMGCKKLAVEIYDKRYPGKRKRDIEMLRIKGDKI